MLRIIEISGLECSIILFTDDRVNHRNPNIIHKYTKFFFVNSSVFQKERRLIS